VSEQSEADIAMQVVNAYNDAWMARDLEGMKATVSDDYIQWHSHIRKEFTKDEEFEMLVEALKVMNIVFHHVHRFPIEGGVAMQCLGDIKLSNGAEAKDVPFAMVYRVRDGKIVRCDEYVDGPSLPQLDFISAS
jgi:ketosteroid isomerase-like protein